jgi:5-methylcytosine-specific restriction endonuclease McrA
MARKRDTLKEDTELAIWLAETNNEQIKTAAYSAYTSAQHTIVVVNSSLYKLTKDKFQSITELPEPDKIIHDEFPESVYYRFLIKNPDITSIILSILRSKSQYERRKGRKKLVSGFHKPEHYKTLWEIQEGKCYYSGQPLGNFEDRRFEVDHIIPISGGGPFEEINSNSSDWPTNLALTDPSINRLKGIRDANSFLSYARRNKLFTPRPYKERRKIDSLRSKAFSEFIRENS